PSGHTPRDRRRVSASGRAAFEVRSRTSETLRNSLPQFRRPVRRNQAKEDEALLQRRNGADCRAGPTRAFSFAVGIFVKTEGNLAGIAGVSPTSDLFRNRPIREKLIAIGIFL